MVLIEKRFNAVINTDMASLFESYLREHEIIWFVSNRNEKSQIVYECYCIEKALIDLYKDLESDNSIGVIITM